MPYVDQGEPKPPTPLPPIVPYAALLVAMAAGFGSFWLLFNAQLSQIIPPLLVGPIIGLALRLTAKHPLPKQGLTAILATLVTCLAGYVFRHVALITWLDNLGNPLNPQPGVGNAFHWLFSADIVSLLCIAMSGYLAFAIGAAIPTSYTPPPQQPPQA